MTNISTIDAVGDGEALRRLEKFGGLKLRRELTTLFLEETPGRIATARRALADGDLAGVRSMAHMLKSSSAQMGAPRLQLICERLEGQDGAVDTERTLHSLDHELARYRAWLDSEFPLSDSA